MAMFDFAIPLFQIVMTWKRGPYWVLATQSFAYCSYGIFVDMDQSYVTSQSLEIWRPAISSATIDSFHRKPIFFLIGNHQWDSVAEFLSAERVCFIFKLSQCTAEIRFTWQVPSWIFLLDHQPRIECLPACLLWDNETRNDAIDSGPELGLPLRPSAKEQLVLSTLILSFFLWVPSWVFFWDHQPRSCLNFSHWLPSIAFFWDNSQGVSGLPLFISKSHWCCC